MKSTSRSPRWSPTHMPLGAGRFEPHSHVSRWRPDWLAGAEGFEPSHQELWQQIVRRTPQQALARSAIPARHDSSKPAGQNS